MGGHATWVGRWGPLVGVVRGIDHQVYTFALQPHPVMVGWRVVVRHVDGESQDIAIELQ